MPKPASKPIVGDMPGFVQPKQPWCASHGMMLAGRAYADEADHTATQMEAKWGADRLRLLVSIELREKFDRQRYKFNRAIWHGQLEDVRTESMRMVKAWTALDKAAEAAGASKLDAEVWEVALEDGSVAAIVRSNAEKCPVDARGRQMAVYTLDEIARLLAGFPALAQAKMLWPGATVTKVGRNIVDPLTAVHDTSGEIDDEIPFGS